MEISNHLSRPNGLQVFVNDWDDRDEKKKSAKRSFPFNTNHTERTHRNFNVFMLWNDSLVKFVSLFLERTLKHKTNNRNLRHKLEGPKLLLIISISVD